MLHELMLVTGAPVDVTPSKDDPDLGTDVARNDNFSFTAVNPDDQTTQTRCPLAAHGRKTNPRGDLSRFGPTATSKHRIIRSGIPFGEEVSSTEKSNDRTTQDRGLLFVCYQSDISNGFQFMQQSMPFEMSIQLY